MSREPVSRREFTVTLAGCVAAPALTARDEPTLPAQAGRLIARFEILDGTGAPVPTSELGRFYLCDLLQRPIPSQPQLSDGMAAFEPPPGPFRVSVPLAVPGFGHVYLYADDRGTGYTPARFASGEPLLLNYEAAADRLATARGLVESLDAAGIDLPRSTQDRIDRAAALLDRAAAAGDRPTRARVSLESLRESLWAGEELVLGRARAAIARRGMRPSFLFGANAFGFPARGQLYAERFEAVFNFATLPFYLGSTERTFGQPDHSSVDSILAWLDGTSLARKGHPLIFFYKSVVPEWLRDRSPEDTMRLSADYVGASVARFRDRIHVWDVVNELHHKNEVDLSKAQLVALTDRALRTAREADPTCFRIVNNCCPWCEYLARDVPLGTQSVYDYLVMLRDAGMSYEAVGLQYYYYGRDMLEIERSLDTFEDFGKPVHITELGTPSSSVEIPTDWPNGVRFPWHGERWSEAVQADWVEQFYTMAFSKAYVEAISWWDMTDPAFIPHGGLLHADLRPKTSYSRLQSLLARWRDAP